MGISLEKRQNLQQMKKFNPTLMDQKLFPDIRKRKVFIQLPTDNATEKEIYEEQKNGIRRLDRQIKALAKELELGVKLSYQWARHSFATNMKLNPKVTDKAVQERMGHKTLTTTQNYYDSLRTEQSIQLKKH